MNDLISRQAAIDALEEHLDYLQMLNKDENPKAGIKWYGVNWARNTIADLPSAQQWIPCFEKLPEENEMVLISAKYIGHLSQNAPYVEEGFFTHDGWYSAYGDDYSELLAKVVAWMPLPKPYKGESDEIQ